MRKLRPCSNCSRETRNLKFCSRSCAAICNNKKYPKSRMTKKCKLCDNKILSQRVYCKNCWNSSEPFPNKPRSIIAHTQDKSALRLCDVLYRRHNRAAAFAYVRWHALKVTKHVKACQMCGYDKHVETHHIRKISSFSNSATLGEINHPDNLLVLCPNHHWEADRGLLN